MGTRIALMRDGIIQQFGTAREIYTDPANTYVARFIGTPPMNLIEAQRSGNGVQTGNVLLRLDAAFPDTTPADVLLGIRPNAIAISRQDDATSLPGTVVMVEHIGADSVIAVQLSDARTAHEADEALDAVMVTVPGYAEFAPGDAVHLRFDMGQAVLFSAQTGERLRP